MTSPAHIFALDHPLIARTLKAKLEKQRADLIADLRFAESWDDFKNRVGQIIGIEAAVAICEQTDKEQRD